MTSAVPADIWLMLGGLALVAAALVTATVIWRGTDSAPTDSGDTLPHRSELS